MVTKTKRVAAGKVMRQLRLNKDVDYLAHLEANKLGFNSWAAWLNNLLTRYFNGETIRREPKS